MKKQNYTLYDNFDNQELFEDVKKELFEESAAAENWQTPENIPVERIYNEVDFLQECYFDDVKQIFEKIFQKNYMIATGTVGTWRGSFAAGKFLESLSDFLQFLQNYDYIKIAVENNHLKIYGYHHDGTNIFELKILTARGVEVAQNQDWAHDRQLHATIANCNFFSRLPKESELML